MHFYYVYKALAHPENNGYVAPFTLQERLMHVAEAQQKLGTRIPWLCDSMDNAAKHAFGDRPNSEFIIDPDGIVVAARDWSDPEQLRRDLAQLVGRSDTTTSVSDLNLPSLPPAHASPVGVVPRLEIPAGMQPVIVTPVMTDESAPFYAKLRAEVEPDWIRTGEGSLYLSFMLDPLYHVHWNNRAMPVVYEIVDSTGVVVAPSDGEGPEPEIAADADPREFLLELCDYLISPSERSQQELTVRVRYFACDDAETFCVPVTQEYRIILTRDSDGGSRRIPPGADRQRGQGIQRAQTLRPEMRNQARRRRLR